MSTTFELLMEIYRSGDTEQFLDLARKCLKEEVLPREESAAIARLLPSFIKNLPQAIQVLCLLCLNRPGMDVAGLCQEAGLSREQVTKALEGKTWSTKTFDALARVLGWEITSQDSGPDSPRSGPE
jgi:DNA-binding phage protein